MLKPITRYAKSGSINIAYQIFGAGNMDLVYIPGWVSNIDLMWSCPELVHFLSELGKVCRVILFDKRGTGLSDRMVELSTLEERMDDIKVVMQAAGSNKAILFGHSEGGCVSALFAATYPNKVISLITFGIFAKRIFAPDYPWAPTDIERKKVYDMIEYRWGSGAMNLESLAPSKADDKAFMDWLANYLRSGASPSAALALTKMNTQVDIIDILPSIKVPALVIQRRGDIDVKLGEGKFIASRIPNATFLELAGDDHLFWVGNTHEILSAMRSFMLESNPIKEYEQRLITLACIKIQDIDVNSIFEQLESIVAQYFGKMINGLASEMVVLCFERPSKAAFCCLEIAKLFVDKEYPYVISIHIQESTLNNLEFMPNESKELLATFLGSTPRNTILVTQSVRHLLHGYELEFREYSKVYDSNSGFSYMMFKLVEPFPFLSQVHSVSSNIISSADAFIEQVINILKSNIDNSKFGVEALCQTLGMSERQLQRKINSKTSKSPIKLVIAVRLYHARELLMAGQHNISEVAYDSGFSSPSYFISSFKKEFGMTPKKFIDSHR